MSHDPFDLFMSGGEDPFAATGASGLLAPNLRTMQPIARLDANALAAMASRLKGDSQEVAKERIGVLAKTRDLPVTYLGVDSVAAIAIGATLAINFTSVEPVRLTDLTIPAAVAVNFVVNGIFIGRTNLLMNAVGIPGDRFVPGATRPPMESPELPASVAGVIQVTNIGGAAQRFIASFDAISLSRPNPDCRR